ncbi:MAG: hypothetical protein K0Q87_3531 [Neobacillus sp.]|jgi:hypothetical protein|nr:hypothetical protein [Neobacillus sp.]
MENTYKQYIEFDDLKGYIGKPVYNNDEKKWKILKGFARIDDELRVMYTETDFRRDSDNWEPYNETMLSVCE